MSKEVWEIWLDSSPEYYGRGIVHQEDGSTVEIDAIVNTATVWDNVVLNHNKTDAINPVGWSFGSQSIYLYDWDESVKEIIFHNESKYKLKISGYGLDEVLTPGETKSMCKNLSLDAKIKGAKSQEKESLNAKKAPVKEPER